MSIGHVGICMYENIPIMIDATKTSVNSDIAFNKALENSMIRFLMDKGFNL
jgi:hypothetical protein